MHQISPERSRLAAPAATLPGVWRALRALPFIGMALLPGLRFGPQASLAALTIATLATFTVFIPLMAVLTAPSGGALGDDLPEVALTPRRYGLLLALWTATAWAAAAYAGLLLTPA